MANVIQIVITGEDKASPVPLACGDELHFEINLDTLTRSDMEILERPTSSGRLCKFLDVLDRIVVGGVRGKNYKYDTLRAIGDAVKAAIMAQAAALRKGKRNAKNKRN